MSMIFTFNKLKKSSFLLFFLFFFLFFCSSINAATYYLRTGGGNWNASTTWSSTSSAGAALSSGYPNSSSDIIIYNGTSTASPILTVNVAASCASFTDSNTVAHTLTISISSGITFAVSGDFGITGTVNITKTLTLSGSGTLTVGGNINIGTSGLSPTTTAKFTKINFQGPAITLSGNLNMYNNINGGNSQGAFVTHSAGKFSLIGTSVASTPGTGGSGYINAYQTGTGLSVNNKYTTATGTAIVEFSHVNDCPIYSQQGITNAPVFTGSGSTITYTGTGTASTIYAASYYNLKLNNPAGSSTNGSVTVQNNLDLVAGNLSIGIYSFSMNSVNASGNMNISSGSGVTSSGGVFTIATPTNITYSGSVTAAGVELVSGTTILNTQIKTLTLSNTSNFNIGTTGTSLFVTDSVTILDNSFTCDLTSITSPAITLSGNGATYNCILNATGAAGLTINGSSSISSSVTAATITCNATTTLGSDASAITVTTLNVNASTTISNDQNISGTLNLAANLTNNGILTVPNINVTNNSTLNGNGTGMIKLGTLLNVTSSKVLTTGGDLTLVSDATNTARVGQVDSGAIVGDVIVERYLKNSNRLWRLLTAPVKGSSNNSIYYNWQNNGNVDGEHGTDVWGPVATYDPASNGMYYIPIATHNFRKYNNGWTSISDSMTEPLFNSNSSNAFLAFITYPAGSAVNVGGGASGENVGISGSGSTTLVAKGNLLTGNQTFSVGSTNYFLIGNPYASPIDFSNIISASGDNGNTIAEKIWIMDPKLGNFGNYVTWDPAGLYNDATAQNALNNNTLIQSGQAFFVKGKSGASSSSFLIKETNKASTNVSNVFGKMANIAYERIRVNVDKVENGLDVHKDACVVTFYQGASNAVDEKDVQKFTNPVETLAFLNGSTSLSSEHRAPIVDADVLFVKLSQAVQSTYKLKIYTENFTFAGTAYLYDLFLGTNVALPLDGSVFVYPFDVTSDGASQGARFKIVFATALSTVKNENPYSIVAYPNPTTKTNGINLNLGSLEYGNYNYKIVNVLGQVVQNGSFDKQQLNQEVAISFNNSVREGWYAIQILDKNTTLQTLPILIK
ncbi:T9SS type A sorting domain-containing protein [Flavobacterium aciduliphilum]|uniref:Secretion system C-terminal sorting domain-containing protein n=1 Tax=Flavobacterium aciduliphilum TaxID=1101402 RepID=A0A328YAS8_9FLAO|nr:T9SS type A sorting domain-containing protein [Flavobacterium aciduliphilum]RAR69288.1 hypothetical protein CLV55_1169 [Flavobacterium aciduliphilum]